MRAIPDDNLGYPVKIVLNNSSGSAFVLNAGKRGIFLCTAKHVLFDGTGQLLASSATATSFSRDLTGVNRLSLNLAELEANGCVTTHDTHDVAIVKIAVHLSGGSSNTIAGVTPVSMVDIVSISADESTKKYDDVLVANDVFLFGYPSSIGLKNIPQLDYDRPLIRKGIIAGKNDTSKTLILDCPVYPGNSGGPLIEVASNQLRLVGVVSKFVPIAETWLNTMHNYTNTTITNSGYSVAEPVDFLFELLDQIGT